MARGRGCGGTACRLLGFLVLGLRAKGGAPQGAEPASALVPAQSAAEKKQWRIKTYDSRQPTGGCHDVQLLPSRVPLCPRHVRTITLQRCTGRADRAAALVPSGSAAAGPPA